MTDTEFNDTYCNTIILFICTCSMEQGPTPVEKKKKGKRKNDTSLDSLELDQGLLSLSGQNLEESVESVDSQVYLNLESLWT